MAGLKRVTKAIRAANAKPKEKPSQCVRCDGSAEICNICGESPGACGCDSEDIRDYIAEYGEQFDMCVDCKGTGK